MKPNRINVYVLGDNEYAIINRTVYRLEACDDEAMAEAFNGGEVIPLASASTSLSSKV